MDGQMRRVEDLLENGNATRSGYDGERERGPIRPRPDWSRYISKFLMATSPCASAVDIGNGVDLIVRRSFYHGDVRVLLHCGDDGA
jgi:hypothetical protein